MPEIAYAHHEKLDGTGYPRRLAAARHPDPVEDDDHLRHLRRPGGLGPARTRSRCRWSSALDILRDEAGAGKLDRQILDLFIEAKVYEIALPRGEAR